MQTLTINSSAPTVDKPINVRFIDIDGSIIYSDWYPIGSNVLFPTPPTRDNLDFIDRTHTSAELTNLQNRESERGLNIPGHIDVGATYKTSDGRTHIWFNATQAYGMTLGVYFSKVASVNANVTIDRGDTTTTTFSLTGASIKPRTYTQEGLYHVQIWTDGNVEYGLGNGSASTQICTTGNMNVKKIYLSEHAQIKGYAFNALRGLEEVSLPPYAGIELGQDVFRDTQYIKHITIPRGYTSIPVNCFYQCIGLRSVVLPQTINSYGNSCFYLTPSMKRLVMPIGFNEFVDGMFNLGSASELISDTITTLGSNAFTSWYLSGVVNLAKSVNANGTGTFANAYSLALDDIDIYFTTTLTANPLSWIHLISGTIAVRGIAGLALPIVSNINSCERFIIGENFTSITGAITSPNIKQYIFEGEVPPVLGNTSFLNNNNFNKSAKIYVPDSALNMYKTATNYVVMAGYMRPMSEL